MTAESNPSRMPKVTAYPVSVAFRDGTIVPARFLISGENREDPLTLSFADRSITKKAIDTFEALVLIRLELEAEGIQVLCYGACKDVRPSGMSRSMGGGVKAYRHALGSKPSPKEMVHILETGSDCVATSVSEQQLYYEEWLLSVGIDKNRKHIPLPLLRFPWHREFHLQGSLLYIVLGLLLILGVIVFVRSP